jgi:hypothetical protein
MRLRTPTGLVTAREERGNPQPWAIYVHRDLALRLTDRQLAELRAVLNQIAPGHFGDTTTPLGGSGSQSD